MVMPVSVVGWEESPRTLPATVALSTRPTGGANVVVDVEIVVFVVATASMTAW
jgi:hypothetical protein